MNFFSELKRRNVFRAAAAYLVAAWLVLQVVDVVVPMLTLPEWTGTLILLLIAAGFPIALVLAWAFDLTPDGVKRTTSISEPAPTAGHRKTDLLIMGGLAVALAVSLYLHLRPQEAESPGHDSDIPSVAVLPLANRSSQLEDAWFAEGIHDEILTHLAKIGTLKVISRTSVMEYADTRKNMRTIAEELGVATILEGGVQRAGDRVRINVQLIDASSDNHLWAEIYDRELTTANVFAIQSEISQAIAGALEAAISPDTLQNLEAVPTANLVAYDYFLQAGKYDEITSGESGAEATDLLRLSVEADPEFGLAWAMLSISLSRWYWDTHDTDARDQAGVAASKAVEIAPQLSESHMAMGYYHYWGYRRYQQALEEFRQARQLAPGAPGPFLALAYVQRRMGQFDFALRNFERAVELDPRGAKTIAFYAEHLRMLGRHEDASHFLDKLLDLAPDNPFVWQEAALNQLELDGDLEKYVEVVQRTIAGESWLAIELYLARMYHGDYAGALDALEQFDQPAYEYQYFYYPSELLAGMAELAAGNSSRAEARFQEAVDMLQALDAANTDDPRKRTALGLSFAGLGRSEQAALLGTQACELLPFSQDRMHSLYYVGELARIQAINGELGLALEQMAMVFDNPGGRGVEESLADPVWNPYREHPDFLAFENKYRRAGLSR